MTSSSGLEPTAITYLHVAILLLYLPPSVLAYRPSPLELLQTEHGPHTRTYGDSFDDLALTQQTNIDEESIEEEVKPLIQPSSKPSFLVHKLTYERRNVDSFSLLCLCS